MLNQEIPYNTSAEVMGQTSSYFTIVENAVATGDTNKRYTITPQSCYAPGPPVQARSFTTFLISPSSDNTADLYNGYINAEMNVSIKTSSPVAAFTAGKYDVNSPTTFWFGFKNARDAIEKYEICANGISIYTQSFAIEEGFLTACGNTEAAKRSRPFEIARHKDIWEGKFYGKCGTAVDVAEKTSGGTTPFDVKIPLCIPLRSILPLSNIRYLPAFAGKIELRVYFSTAGMVYCPVGYKAFIKTKANLYNSTLAEITNEFVQIGDAVTYAYKFTDAADSTPAKFDAASTTCTAENYYIERASSVVPCFGIDNNIYMALQNRYVDSALTFPTQTLAMFPCANKLNSVDAKTTQTVTPRFIESIFMLFPWKTTHKTIYHNPNFTGFQLQCGGYGSIPSVSMATFGDPLFITLCQNSMNLNGSVSGLNKEVIRSLTTNFSEAATLGVRSDEETSFFLGLPTETDNCFQQGMTSNTPITFEVHVKQESKKDSYMQVVDATPIMCFLVDSTFSIQVQPNGAPPLVELGAYDITSPVE